MGLAASGQELTQTIRGQVIDKDSRIPLVGANVVLLNSDPFKGASTDINGEFRLEEVPLGRHEIKVTYLGYNDLILPNIVVNSGKEVVLTVSIEETYIQAKEIVVIGRKKKNDPQNEMSLIGARTFSIEETNKYAGSWGDPARMATYFAGVIGGNDQRNDIVVRGNSPVGILWRMDGVEIPNPNHFSTSGATGGGISMLNNNLLDNSDFITSAFNAEYGNAISGVFDLRMRKGNNEKREYIFQIGANGFEVGAEGPFRQNKNASYLVNYRYSTLGVLDAFGALDFIGSVPQYQDISFKFHIPHPKGYFAVFGVGGVSKIEFDAVKDSLTWSEKPDDQYYEIAGSKMGTLGLTYMHFLNDKTYLKTILASSFVNSYYRQDALDGNYDFLTEFNTSFSEAKQTFSLLFNKKFSARSTFRTGIIANNLYFDIETKDYYYDSYWQPPFIQTVVDFDGNGNLLQAYGQWKYKLAENLVMNTGLHGLHYFLNDRQSLEPRLALKWTFFPRQSLSLGYGSHSRLLPAGVYFGEVEHPGGYFYQPNKSLDFTKANHFVLGYDYSITEDLRLKLETYYQYLYKVPVMADTLNSFSGLNIGADYVNIVSRDLLVNKGEGENYGVELTFEKFFSRQFYFLVTGSLFESKYSGSDGIRRNTVFNGNYAYNFLGGKEFRVGKHKSNLIGAYLTVVNIGGKRTTPIDLQASRDEGQTVYVESLAYTEKQPDYFRMDIRLSYRQNKAKFSHELAFEAKNLFNTKNIFLEYYDTTSDEVVKLYQMGLFPIAFYRIEF